MIHECWASVQQTLETFFSFFYLFVSASPQSGGGGEGEIGSEDSQGLVIVAEDLSSTRGTGEGEEAGDSSVLSDRSTGGVGASSEGERVVLSWEGMAISTSRRTLTSRVVER